MSGEHIVMQLGLLIEAAGRVQSIAGKSIRWGLSSINRIGGESNREILLRELSDLRATIVRIESTLAPSVGQLSVRSQAEPVEPANGA